MSEVVPLSPLVHPALKWLFLVALALAPAMVGIYFSAIALSGPLLDTSGDTIAAKVDVMVVLGGDGPTRAEHALTLWRQNSASTILVTGDGDCTSIAGALVAGGVAEADVTMECQSGSTWQNAEFSAPILTSLGAHSAIIVTNWFHARRALASFRAMCPRMRFAVASVPAPSFVDIVTGPYGVAVAGEYIKTPWYAVGLWWRGLKSDTEQGAEVPQWTHC